jgi:hypothetical protein
MFALDEAPEEPVQSIALHGGPFAKRRNSFARMANSWALSGVSALRACASIHAANLWNRSCVSTVPDRVLMTFLPFPLR